MSSDDPRLSLLRDAAIEWAAGGRGQDLVNAAAEALAVGIDSPTLRLLAGAPRVAADEEAAELAGTVFAELGLEIAPRRSEDAIITFARLEARRFIEDGGSPRALARRLYGMCVAADHAEELTIWSEFDDWYDMLGRDLIEGSIEEVDSAVVEAARALVERRRIEPPPIGASFVASRPLRARGLLRMLRRRGR